MVPLRAIRTADDLEIENRELRRAVTELAGLVLDAEERALVGSVAPFEGWSLIVHERTWARVRAAAEQALGRSRPTGSFRRREAGPA